MPKPKNIRVNGEAIRTIRERSGWSLEDLAASCESLGVPITKGTLSKIETSWRASGLALTAIAWSLQCREAALYATPELDTGTTTEPAA